MFNVGRGCTNYWTWVDGVFRVIECLVDKQRQQISWTAGRLLLIVSAVDGRSGVNVWPVFSNQDELPAQWILTAARQSLATAKLPPLSLSVSFSRT